MRAWNEETLHGAARGGEEREEGAGGFGAEEDKSGVGRVLLPPHPRIRSAGCLSCCCFAKPCGAAAIVWLTLTFICSVSGVAVGRGLSIISVYL